MKLFNLLSTVLAALTTEYVEQLTALIVLQLTTIMQVRLSSIPSRKILDFKQFQLCLAQSHALCVRFIFSWNKLLHILIIVINVGMIGMTRIYSLSVHTVKSAVCNKRSINLLAENSHKLFKLNNKTYNRYLTGTSLDLHLKWGFIDKSQ